MPDTRTMQSPYPRGQSFASVPVLFSLPNVQPVIAAASTGVANQQETPRIADPTPEPTLVGSLVDGSPNTYASTPIVVTPTVNAPARGDSRWSSWASQFTNVTIGVLLIAVVALGYRNLQQNPTKTASDHESVASQSTQSVSDSRIDDSSVPSLTIASEVDLAPKDPRFQPDPVATVSQPPRIQEPPAARMAARTVAPSQVPLNTVPAGTESVSVESQRPTEPSSPNVSPEQAAPLQPPSSQKPGIPLLLPPVPQSSIGAGNRAVAAEDESLSSPSGPYGSSSYGSSPTSTPFSLTSASLTQAQSANPATSNPSGARENIGTQADLGPRTLETKALETATPALNTRDIILMRNGQRRTTGSSAALDNSIPKVESMPRLMDSRSSGPANSSGTVMSGQPYPPIAPQYEPISVNSNGANPNRYQPIGGTASPQPRITQPSAATPGGAPAQPYKPLSPVLPNPSETLDFDDANP